MVIALARCLEGRPFSGFGQSPWLQMLVRRAGWLPRRLRERAFARLGAREGVEPADIDRVRADRIADWIQGQYPRRRYPAVMIGSSNGALLHLAAALHVPWLPQTFLTLVRQTHVHPDDARHAMQAEQHTAERFLAANPGLVLHHMHDPAQDRLMLGLIAYYRAKFRRLPPAYREFLDSCLEPGGTLIVVDCDLPWPVRRLGERHVYQFGAVGGPTTQEYFEGSERVAAYLQQQGSPRRRWQPPAPDTQSPEAEWGFEPGLRADLAALACERGYRILRLRFTDPEHPSPLVAELYRDWNLERGASGRRLVVESFIVMEPYRVLRTGSVPYWMTFNMRPSLERVSRYLDTTDPYDEIVLMLFAHGVDSVGLPTIEEWAQVLARARRRGVWAGLNPAEYPAHFASFGRYSQALRDAVPARQPLPEPLELQRVERYIEKHGAGHGVKLEGP